MRIAAKLNILITNVKVFAEIFELSSNEKLSLNYVYKEFEIFHNIAETKMALPQFYRVGLDTFKEFFFDFVPDFVTEFDDVWSYYNNYKCHVMV